MIWLALNPVRLHPLVVHLPIGIILFVAVMEVLQRWGKHRQYDSAIRLGLWVGVLSSGIAALSGWGLASEGGYENSLLDQHRWFGIGVFGLSLLALLAHSKLLTFFHRLYAISISLLLLVMIWTGHLGGSLTHGKDYLFSKPKPKQIVEDINDAQIYPVVIQSILNDKCVHCHKETKTKGGLLMVDQASLLKGGDSGSIINPDSAELSMLWKRIHLPMDDEEHMPPAGKIQLTRGDMALLTWWMENGSCMDCKVSDLPDQAAMAPWLASYTGEEFGKDLPIPSDKKINRLTQRGIGVMRLGEDSPWLAVDLSRKEPLSKSDMKAVTALGPHVIEFHAGFSDFRDELANQLGSLKNLKVLSLQGTSVSDVTVNQFQKLERLEKVNLYGTQVTNKSLIALSGISSLRQLFAWSTAITPAELEAWQDNLDHPITVQTGINNEFFGKSTLNPPVFDARSIFFQDSLLVELKSNMEGLTAYYTLDGSEPDTTSLIFPDSLVLYESAELKVFQTKPGWNPSEVVREEYVKAEVPIAQVDLHIKPSIKYSASGGRTLRDLEKGSTVFQDGKWLGYEGSHMKVSLDLGEERTVSSLSISALSAPGSWIFFPKGVTIKQGLSREALASLKEEMWASVDQEITNSELRFFTLHFDPIQTRYLEVEVLSPLKNPDWHPAPGGNSWIFVDEILVN